MKLKHAIVISILLVLFARIAEYRAIRGAPAWVSYAVLLDYPGTIMELADGVGIIDPPYPKEHTMTFHFASGLVSVAFDGGILMLAGLAIRRKRSLQ